VSDAVVCLPGEGEQFERGNRTITILADTPELSLLELIVTPGWEGVDPHTHDDHVDGFFSWTVRSSFSPAKRPPAP